MAITPAVNNTPTPIKMSIELKSLVTANKIPFDMRKVIMRLTKTKGEGILAFRSSAQYVPKETLREYLR